MKKNIILTTLAAAAIALAACDKEEPRTAIAPAEVIITASIQGNTPHAGTSTQATTRTETRADASPVKEAFATNDAITLTYKIGNAEQTVRATYTAHGTWATDPERFYIDTRTTAGDITVTYLNNTDPAAVNVDGTIVTTYYDNLDGTVKTLTAPAPDTDEPYTLHLGFTHAGALFKVTSNGEEGLRADYDLIYLNGTDDVGNTITLKPNDGGLCLAPVKFTLTGITLRETGQTNTTDVAIAEESSITTAAGQSYTINLLLNTDPITLTVGADELPAWNNHNPSRPANTATLHYIYDKEDLIAFRNEVNGGNPTLNALQMTDIDLENETWTPIGTGYNYSGTYNGNGYTLTGLKVAGDVEFTGLFGYTNGATLINIHLVEASVTTTYPYAYAGALVGDAGNTTIALCSSTGTVDDGQFTGGLVGAASDGTHITRSLSTCDVSTGIEYARAGGLTGDAGTNTVIAACMAGGTVNATNTGSIAGGFVGYNTNGATITHCYVTEATTADGTTTYGFAGINRGKIAYSYTTRNNFGIGPGTRPHTWSLDEATATPGDVVRTAVADDDITPVRTWANGKVQTTTFGPDSWTNTDYPTIKFNNHGTIQ